MTELSGGDIGFKVPEQAVAPEPLAEIKKSPEMPQEQSNDLVPDHNPKEDWPKLVIPQPIPEEEIVTRVTAPENWTNDDRVAFNEASAYKRTWKGVAQGVWGQIKKSIAGQTKQSEQVVDYTPENNYILSYEDCYAGPKYWKLVTDKLELNKTDPSEILEIGCASGNLLEVISELSPQSKLTAVDISKNSLDMAAKRLPDTTDLYQGDLNDESFMTALAEKIGQKKYKAIILLDVVEHLQTPEKQNQLIELLSGLLDDGGKMVVGMPELAGPKDPLFKRLFKNAWNKADVDATHFNKPTPERFNQLMSGLDIVEDHGYFPVPQPIGSLMKLPFSANRMMVGMKKS